MYNGLVAVQWALVDHNRGEGGFCCVPGSHRANFPRPSGHPASWVVEVPMMAGDVVIFTEALTHGTSTWTAPYERRSLLYKYAPGHSTWGTQYQSHARCARHQRTAQRAPATADADPRRQSPQAGPLTTLDLYVRCRSLDGDVEAVGFTSASSAQLSRRGCGRA